MRLELNKSEKARDTGTRGSMARSPLSLQLPRESPAALIAFLISSYIPPPTFFSLLICLVSPSLPLILSPLTSPFPLLPSFPLCFPFFLSVPQHYMNKTRAPVLRLGVLAKGAPQTSPRAAQTPWPWESPVLKDPAPVRTPAENPLLPMPLSGLPHKPARCSVSHLPPRRWLPLSFHQAP